MRLIRIIIVLLLFTSSAIAAEEGVLNVAQKVDQLSADQNIGSLDVAGVGVVKFTASRLGTQLKVQAVNSDNMLIGLAESVVGTVETPIFITTPTGLTQLTVIWKNP